MSVVSPRLPIPSLFFFLCLFPWLILWFLLFLFFYSSLTFGTARLYLTRYACSWLQSAGVRCVIAPSFPPSRYSSLPSRRLRPRPFTSLLPSSYVKLTYHLAYYPHPVKSSSVRDPSCVCSLSCNRLYILLLESGQLAIVFACRRCFALLAVYTYTFSLLT